VEFYKKFGFVVQREEELIGMPTWYMWRATDEQIKADLVHWPNASKS